MAHIMGDREKRQNYLRYVNDRFRLLNVQELRAVAGLILEFENKRNETKKKTTIKSAMKKPVVDCESKKIEPVGRVIPSQN